MNAILHIEIEDQQVKYTNTPPKSLSQGLFHLADIWAVSDPRVDILIQRKSYMDNAFWKYSFVAHQNVKLYFYQPVQSIFMFFNIGKRLKVQLGHQAPTVYNNYEYNMFTMPEFRLTAYPAAGKNKFELFLMDIGKGDRNSVTSVLAAAAQLNQLSS
ncbi:hypothetical protein [Arachidicoccus terrestris]|uniref:hypothetical protein n=1 Tax=Arachidicoccus terrestris TaxID=2875539 RepID=UPI001CC7E371|nr:hypothetical protein [Arachidicoccus terrestris]UAY56021.1 hypothetical protein K9M52_03040 [Arachidicoccus terrestris]